ncbi:ATP-binding protein [Cereibacter sphaeroides]|uniref:ATP-binding protein n=1 Tax=Cereibacter sphaeroides TaxID=1063 RepID=UPI001F213671|nr:ATP-binding protein [Cereibacter sphaeroides]MCE6949792.1 ATP-binding protein [Cereibacter sphaeroides]
MNLALRDRATTLAALKGIHLKTERDDELELQLDRLLEVDDQGQHLPSPVRFTAGLETRGIALIEPAGGGKTTAVRRLLAGCSTLSENPETGQPRHLLVNVRTPVTLRSLGLGVLAQLGVKVVSARTTVWEIWDLVRHRLALAGIVVLWLDEAHDLFSCKAGKDVDDMLKMIKGLMQGDAPVIVILSGTERLSEMTSYDPQVKRRFSLIRPKDMAIGADNDTIEQLIAYYAEEAGLGYDPGQGVAGRLIHGSRRRFGRSIETIIAAIDRALREGTGDLTLYHFALAYGAAEGCDYDKNVFVAEDWISLDLDAEAREFEASRKAERRRPRT